MQVYKREQTANHAGLKNEGLACECKSKMKKSWNCEHKKYLLYIIFVWYDRLYRISPSWREVLKIASATAEPGELRHIARPTRMALFQLLLYSKTLLTTMTAGDEKESSGW